MRGVSSHSVLSPPSQEFNCECGAGIRQRCKSHGKDQKKTWESMVDIGLQIFKSLSHLCLVGCLSKTGTTDVCQPQGSAFLSY